ncbi:26S proteasome non-ATPase regulatory subunit Nas2 [Blastomyces dermatitidis ER-3]|uniref:26S proteasome non-ATPase regulatory subunit Nas2 n=1 Tax=Ajellomyces dermatitidis (strain ER-3 / ATCC MYA-2586) TaxID=559297 RepID=A0ABP2F4D1_AJEDR|nr:26S proteasome non-ATPase regulatory subunit Nas2 [Blastomyces dermatitidis ER-3]EEQ91533.1 26S proteasome non-ATPase regulatory subunit Nas2 [Blastomyces dermatitidis ER-3]
MGIPMDDDIHAPTLASGPTSAPTRNGRELSSLSLDELFDEKERLEAEFRELSSVLDSHGVTMLTSLTTFDGYPRDDLDIAQIRTTRARIIHLRNDYKDVMARVEQGVHEGFARLRDQQNANCPPTTTTSTPSTWTSTTSVEDSATSSAQAGIIETPFAKINNVADGSPAAQAGIKVGDRVRSVGHVNWMNHENLTKVAEVVRRNEGKTILVKLVRKDESGEMKDLTVQLTPRRNWGGLGLLGCHIVLV